eukprot:47755-Eustigmatos_ZCMA.PRE.1
MPQLRFILLGPLLDLGKALVGVQVVVAAHRHAGGACLHARGERPEVHDLVSGLGLNMAGIDL